MLNIKMTRKQFDALEGAELKFVNKKYDNYFQLWLMMLSKTAYISEKDGRHTTEQSDGRYNKISIPANWIGL